MDLITDLAPYRARAAQLVDDIIAGRVGAFDDATELMAKLDERFVHPLTAALDAIPVGVRAGSQLHDARQHDAISGLVDAFAGMNELGVLLDYVNDWAELDDEMTGRDRELAEAGIRYRALMAGAPT